MEGKHKVIIQRNYESLVNDSMSVDHITRILVNKGVLSSTFIEDNKKKTSLERKRGLFRHILKCGTTAFQELVFSLRETNQEKLANLLDPNRKFESPKMPPNHRIFHNGVLTIKLIRSKKFCDVESEIPTYRCRSKKRGAILIANNIVFNRSDLDARQGSQHDVSNLKNLFGQMNFNIELVEDQAGEDLEKAIKEFFRNSDKYDCLFLVLMSHGGQDSRGTYIYGSDAYRLYTSSVEHYATNVMSSHLYGVPKVLLYNICRGDKVDLGTRVPKNGTGTESAATLTVQSFSDLLIGNATLMDFVAHRDFERGAWYIRNLVEIMEKYAHAHNMEDMLKMVSERVAKHRSDRLSMQTPTYTNIGFKQLFLNPGIYEEKGQLKTFENDDVSLDNIQSQTNGNIASVSNEDVGVSCYAISGDTVEH